MSNTVTKRGVTVKKTVLFICMIVLLFCISINAGAENLYYNDEYHYYDAGEIGLKINGKSVEGLPMSPVIINDYTMVPAREVFESLGSTVVWHDDTCQVEIKDNGISVFVKIGDRNTLVNGKTVVIKEPQPLPMLIGKEPTLLKTMVPVRFIAENLGYDVKWDNTTRCVLISDKKSDDSDMIIGSTENEDEDDVIPEKEGSFGKVTAETDEKYDYVYISTRYGISPDVIRFENPQRIVFDFPGAAFDSLGDTLKVGGICVDTVRYSNHEDKARLVLDINENTQAVVMSSEKGILIRAEKSDNQKLVYDAFSKKVYFDKQYVGNGKSVDGGYRVSFTNLKLKDQTIEINDDFISEIKIVESNTGCSITVYSKSTLSYTAEKGFFKTDKPQEDDNQKPVINNGKLKIVIDAGHGGDDPGAVGYNSAGKAVAYESHINLSIALMVGKKLENSGYDVIYTRNKDVYISLQERADIANNTECDLFVSIHCNSIDKADIDGTQVYYHPASEIGTVLAENIYESVLDLTDLTPRKTQNGSHLFVIRSTSSPAVLVETAFISNASDREFLLSKDGQQKLAEAIYNGIIETVE